jgi:hypothetical protein
MEKLVVIVLAVLFVYILYNKEKYIKLPVYTYNEAAKQSESGNYWIPWYRTGVLKSDNNHYSYPRYGFPAFTDINGTTSRLDNK